MNRCHTPFVSPATATEKGLVAEPTSNTSAHATAQWKLLATVVSHTHTLFAAHAAAPVSAEHVSQSSGPPHAPSVAAAGSEYTV